MQNHNDDHPGKCRTWRSVRRRILRGGWYYDHDQDSGHN
jgi:hypothetical protein